MLGLKVIYQVDEAGFTVGQNYIINGQLVTLIAISKTGFVFSDEPSKTTAIAKIFDVNVPDILNGKYEGYTTDGVKVIGTENGFDV